MLLCVLIAIGAYRYVREKSFKLVRFFNKNTYAMRAYIQIIPKPNAKRRKETTNSFAFIRAEHI